MFSKKQKKKGKHVEDAFAKGILIVNFKSINSLEAYIH